MNMRDEGAIVGRANVDDITLFQPLPVQEKTVGCNRSHRHLGHDLPLSSALVIRSLMIRFPTRVERL
jgi:hypothetical protein